MSTLAAPDLPHAPAPVGVKFLVLWLSATIASYAFAAAIARPPPLLRSVL
ncbi:MAG TPA: hypothetical protein VKV24_18545 [Casimicrobiaceae bacterium]|nr:hypothetical protein [Casimicrobiaceae bacterium]